MRSMIDLIMMKNISMLSYDVQGRGGVVDA